MESMMQVYVVDSVAAVHTYIKAFDGELKLQFMNPERTIYEHAEVHAYGQIIAVAESNEMTYGDNLQFCFRFQDTERDQVDKAYEVLKCDARKVILPLGECNFSPHIFVLIDKFGVYWCIFTV